MDRLSSELLGFAPDARVLIVNCVVHPAHGNEQRQAIEPAGRRIRRSDHAFLTSPRAREILDQEGITVIDYRPLRQARNA